MKKWEARERKKACEYEKEKERETERQNEEAKEARRLREFLEDYDDERDDVKYYKWAYNVEYLHMDVFTSIITHLNV